MFDTNTISSRRESVYPKPTLSLERPTILLVDVGESTHEGAAPDCSKATDRS